MRKAKVNSNLIPVKSLIDRQRNLYSIAEKIELFQKFGEPLPEDISEWLHRALKNIACGSDANEVFNVIPEKQGVRKDGFLQEKRRKLATAYIAAATEDGAEKKTLTEAIKKISEAMPAVKKSTIRKNYNKAKTLRKPIFSFGKK